MHKTLGSILAGLIFLQGGLPVAGVGLSHEAVAGAELAIGVLVAGLSAYLSKEPLGPPVNGLR